MEWILRSERMPEEKAYHEDGRNYADKKDRDWTESERVLVVDDSLHYYTDWVRNGKFKSDGHKDCDGFPHYVIAWIPIPNFPQDLVEDAYMGTIKAIDNRP